MIDLTNNYKIINHTLFKPSPIARAPIIMASTVQDMNAYLQQVFKDYSGEPTVLAIMIGARAIGEGLNKVWFIIL